MLIVGSGFGGICIAIKLKKLGIPFIVIERNGQVGGTWYSNTYPGCACDIPIHGYSYSFERWSSWSTYYAGQPEILRYLLYCVEKYCIQPHIHFNQTVSQSVWSESGAVWKVTTSQGYEFTANIVVSAIGVFQEPNMPDIPGLKGFRGTYFHSSRWDHSLDLQGKCVGVVGNAASAIQMIPKLAKVAKRLIVFQRTPQWISKRHGFEYPKIAKWMFRFLPPTQWFHRFRIWWDREMTFFLFADPSGKEAESFTSHIKKNLELEIPQGGTAEKKNRVLAALLSPAYQVGCKRLLVSDDYYSTLLLPSVSLIAERVVRVVGEGVVVGGGRRMAGEVGTSPPIEIHARPGKISDILPPPPPPHYPPPPCSHTPGLHECDVLVFATGFRVGFTSFPVYGRGGLLQLQWGDTPRAYLGISTPHVPNYFWVLGPNTGLGHNSMTYMIECQSNYITHAVMVMLRRGVMVVDVKKDACNTYYENTIWRKMRTKVWNTGGCNSHYHNSHGQVTALWPDLLIPYWWLTRKFCLADYNYTLTPTTSATAYYCLLLLLTVCTATSLLLLTTTSHFG